jgi:hypothetical protein
MLTDSEVIRQHLNDINEKIHSVGLYFKIDVADDVGYTSYPDSEIPASAVIVLASFDFAYYHQLEFVFYGTQIHNLPTDDAWRDHWEKPQLQLLEGNARAKALNVLNFHQPDPTFIFAFNAGSFGDRQFYVVADGFSYLFETVFYYDREKTERLKADERIGWWLLKMR